MAENSKIEWTTHTFNPWWGCQRVSPGCEHCYAETWAKRVGEDVWGPAKTTPRRELSEGHWSKPLGWNRKAEAAGKRALVFCASMADVFEDHPQLPPLRARLWELIEATPWLDWQILTKRPENVMAMVPKAWREAFPPNVWLGTSVEDQRRADERIPHLLRCPAAVRFLSCEPLLGPVELRRSLMAGRNPGLCLNCGRGHGFSRCPNYGGVQKQDAEWGCDEFRRVESPIGWVIVGGESGPGARPCDVAWIRSLVRQGRDTGVATFVKQLGARPRIAAHHDRLPPAEDWKGVTVECDPDAGIFAHLRDRKGGDPSEWPEDLRVREFPTTQGRPDA